VRVEVRGDFLPRHIFGAGHIIFAILRNLWLSLCIWLGGHRCDCLFVDQISVGIPILKLTSAKILFYCHFPDLLLTKRTSLLKRLYRIPVDWLEEFTTGMADRILVNSNFTKQTYNATFKRLAGVIEPGVLYPSINFANYDLDLDCKEAAQEPRFDTDTLVLLSINRFERKKNIGLCIEALAEFRSKHSPKQPVKVVVAGGYDTRVSENVEYHKELKALAITHNMSTSEYPDLKGDVVFLRSFSQIQRSLLLDQCCCVLYTPENEHFGIVPVEAMYAGRPVIAANSGGPKESVVSKHTGMLCEPTPIAFAQGIAAILNTPDQGRQMGKNGRQHVLDKFAFDTFAHQLNDEVQQLAATPPSLSYRVQVLSSMIVAVASVAGLLFWRGNFLIL
jgi:alpha-1,3/alpha-1,6-mannosyltransferase